MERKHGGNIFQAARQKGLTAENIIDFSANINPLGMSPKAKKIIASSCSAVSNYPDNEAYEFINELSIYHDLPANNFIVGNGSSEFISLLPAILRPKSVLMVAPTFSEYAYNFHRAKGVVFYLNTQKKDGFAAERKTLLDELKRGYSALYLCNPCNPTGVMLPADMVEEIITAASKKGTCVILDESYMDFSENNSVKSMVKKHDNLIILRSMSHFFAMPGLRIGYVISHIKHIEKIRERQTPWSVNAIAQQAGIESLKDLGFIQKSIKYNNDTLPAFAKDLQSLPFLTVFESHANFILFRINQSAHINPEELYEKLLAKKLLVRMCGDFQELDNSFFRVSVKKKNDNKKLVSIMKKIMGA